MTEHGLPPGWDEERVRRLLARYESQSEDEAIAEDEAASAASRQTLMVVPDDLAPMVRELIRKHTK